MVVVLVADHLVFHKTLLCVSSNEWYKWPALSAQWLAQWLAFTKMLLSCSVFTSQTPRRIDCLCRIHEMWHCYRRKGTSVRSHRGCPCFADGTLCLRSTNCSGQACGPVQSASLGRPWWHHLWSQTHYQKPQSWALMVGGYAGQMCSNPRHCLELNQHWNRVPLLLIHDGLPWHPNNKQEWTLLHTAVPEWWSGLFHQIAPIAQVVARKMLGHMHKSRHSCPEFWVCLGLFGVHRLYHLRLQWHMPTKGPWAHHDSTCCAWCGKRASWKLQGWSAIGLEPNRLLVIPDRFTKPASSSHWMRKTEYIYVPWYAGDFQTVGGFQGSLISTKQPNANKWTTRKSLVGWLLQPI